MPPHTKPPILSDEEYKALQKLQEILANHDEASEIEIFDKKEVEVIRKMIALYQSFSALGVVGSMAKNAVIWAGVMAGAYFAFTEYIIKFIKSHAGG